MELVLLLLATGFRPFFLGAALLASIAMTVWALVLGGHLSWVGPLNPIHWHAHEMVFGFTMAVFAGFLLTAAQNWTQQTTATGPALGALFGLWFAGRVAAVIDLGWLGLALDIAFPLVLAAVVGRPLVATGSRRNYAFVGLLAGLSGVDLAWHLGWLSQAAAVVLTLDAMLLLIVIVGGRIVPMFTRNALPESGAHKRPAVDRVALGLTWALLLVDAVSVAVDISWLVAVVAGLAGIAHVVRMSTWGSAQALTRPMLAILHAGYAWICVSLFARAAVGLGVPLAATIPTHLFTVGVLGAFTLGMVSRVSLGHTGRPIVAGRVAIASYVAISIAVLLRIWAGISPSTHALVAAAAAFGVAFALFLVGNIGVLLSPRADGRAG